MIRVIGQSIFLLLALLLIIEGILGPQFAPKNLATLFIWIHYRGLLVLVLLFLGNYFCTFCPMVLLRNMARYFVVPPFSWPRFLQKKWLGILLFSIILFSYEYFDIWASPLKTALLTIAIFLFSLGTDLLFKKASFCKYLCPIGQFNFLSSTLSPQVIKVKDHSVCATCTTYECLLGNNQKKLSGKLGCELDLFLPQKVGNMDCTFCMECIQACPSNNVAINLRLPGIELQDERHRAGIGKFSKRHDLQYLILIFTFGALLNALGMVGPAYAFQEFIMTQFKLENDFFPLLILFIFFLGCLPIIAKKTIPSRLISTFLPLGFGIWLAHYSFHFLTGLFTFVPILQEMMGIPGQFPLQWMGVPESIVFSIEMGFLFLGFIISLGTHYQLRYKSNETMSKSTIFWQVALSIFALWILSLPMEMRGMA